MYTERVSNTYEITLIDNDETIIVESDFINYQELFFEFCRDGKMVYMISKDQIKYVRNLTLVAEDMINAKDPE